MERVTVVPFTSNTDRLYPAEATLRVLQEAAR
jgi:hypothetical protein